MLSSVAERVYWAARYLERVESTARLVSIYDKLMFDLARSVNLSWYNLIIINDLETQFDSRFSNKDERNVVKFLLGDEANPTSMLTSLNAIRENVRTTRDVLPEDTWELTNELCLFVKENYQQGISRSKRHEFLEDVVKGCQQIQGMLYSTMPHDYTRCFWRIGRQLERSDMTTRNLEAGVAAIVALSDEEMAINSHQIIWGNVLRSLGALQSYRRATKAAVQGEEVVCYLLENPEFPKSIAHCLDTLINTSLKLPHSKKMVTELKTIQSKVLADIDCQTLGAPLLSNLNELQLMLGNIHFIISEAWFPENI